MAMVRYILVLVVLVPAWFVSADLEGGLDDKMTATMPPLPWQADLSQDKDQSQNQIQDKDQSQDHDQDQEPDGAEEEEDPLVSSEDQEAEGDTTLSPEDEEDEEDEGDGLSVSQRLELVNKNLEGDGDSTIEDGDVAVPKSHVQKRNADRCVRRGCKWPKKRGKVYVPYVIANHYSSRQRARIRQAFRSFSATTCIRFVPRRRQRDYLYIHSNTGCWSYIGRRRGRQRLSLKRAGCVYLGTIQHELLHALGFHHEHKRSDRDRYIRVLWGNIRKGKKHNFRRANTLNLGTPYDWKSVMHYHKTAFTKNGKPTLVARRGRVTFGRATRMSSCDIARVNRLYCR